MTTTTTTARTKNRKQQQQTAITHLHFGGEEEARRPHENPIVLLEGVPHEKPVKKHQRSGNGIDRPVETESGEEKGQTARASASS